MIRSSQFWSLNHGAMTDLNTSGLAHARPQVRFRGEAEVAGRQNSPTRSKMTLNGHARPPETGYNLWRAGCELIVLPMLKLTGNPRGCDGADCGLAQTARDARVHSALCRERY